MLNLTIEKKLKFRLYNENEETFGSLLDNAKPQTGNGLWFKKRRVKYEIKKFKFKR